MHIYTVHDYDVKLNGSHATVFKCGDVEKRLSSLEMLEVLKNASSIEIPANTTLKGIATDIKTVAIEEAARSWGPFFIDLFARIFECFGAETSLQRINRALAIVSNKQALAKIDEATDEISSKLESRATYKDALPLIMKLAKEEIAKPFKEYFEACLKFNDDESAQAALNKCLTSYKLAEAAIYDELLARYNSWKA